MAQMTTPRPLFGEASKLTAARELVADAIAKGGFVTVACAGCAETVGAYVPGRVEQPSKARPTLRLQCTRRGCRTTTIVTMGEVCRGKFVAS